MTLTAAMDPIVVLQPVLNTIDGMFRRKNSTLSMTAGAKTTHVRLLVRIIVVKAVVC